MMKKNRVTEPTNDNKIKGLVEALTGIVLILGVGAAILLYRHELEALAGFGYAGIFVIALLSAATIFIPAPGLAIAASSAIALNPLLVGIIGGTGAAFGELTSYFVGKGIADIRHGALLEQYKKWIEKYDVYAIIVIAAIPNPLFDIASIAAGLLKIPWQRFFLAALIGNIIKYTLVSMLFALFGGTLLAYL